jgi:outer membrane biosynthesis protein TonB
MSQHHSKPGSASFIGSAALHLAVGVVLWASTAFRPAPPVFETYAIDLYSPPPAVESEEPELTPPVEELVVEAPVEEPDPTPPPPEPEPDPLPEPPPPEPEPTRPAPPPPVTTEPEPERPQPSRGPDAEPSSQGGEDMNIRMEGLRRDYPDYYGNIVLQIRRCFLQRRPPDGRWEAQVDFFIARDGRTVDIRFAKESANTAFNFQAMGAVECAGSRFGPLPEDMPLDRLPVRFTFNPAGPGAP